MIGGNKEVVKFLGINIKNVIMKIFILMGFLLVLVGIVFILRFDVVIFGVGMNMEFDVIVVVIFGGISILGGEGIVLGVIIGVLIMVSIDNGMSFLNFEYLY